MMAAQKPLTGRKVLVITLTAFGVVIGANLALLVFAVGTFPGLEVKNSYVASQSFDKDLAAQEALDWTVSTFFDGGVFELGIQDETGSPIQVKSLDVSVGQATHAREDQSLDLQGRNGRYFTTLSLPPGNWQIRVRAVAQDGTLFQQRLPLVVGKSDG